MAETTDPQPADKPRSRFWSLVLRGATEGLSAIVLFALMVMTCIDVFGREVLNAPLDGATELTQLMLALIVFGALPVVCLRDDHVTVDLFDRWFPVRLMPPRRVIINLLTAVIMAVVCWRVWVIGALQMDYGDTTEFLRIQLGPISYFIAVMSGISAIALFVAAVAEMRGGAPPERHETDTI